MQCVSYQGRQAGRGGPGRESLHNSKLQKLLVTHLTSNTALLHIT